MKHHVVWMHVMVVTSGDFVASLTIVNVIYKFVEGYILLGRHPDWPASIPLVLLQKCMNIINHEAKGMASQPSHDHCAFPPLSAIQEADFTIWDQMPPKQAFGKMQHFPHHLRGERRQGRRDGHVM